MSDINRFQFERQPFPALRVPKPIDVFQLQSTVSTVFTAQEEFDFQIESLVASNVSGAADYVTMHLVPDGGSASAANMIVHQKAIPANAGTTIFNRENMGLLQPGMMLQALCSTNDAVNIYGFGYDYQGIFNS